MFASPTSLAWVLTGATALAAGSAMVTTRDALAGGCLRADTGMGVIEICSRTSNQADRPVTVAQDWCSNPGGPCAGTYSYPLQPGSTTPDHEDWDAFFVPAHCEYRGRIDLTLRPDVNFSASGSSNGDWVKVSAGERYQVQQIFCNAPGGPTGPDDPRTPPDGPTRNPPSPSQPLPRSRIIAVGAGVDGGSVDLLSARPDSDGFATIVNGRHAPGFGWSGLKVVAGDFNGDGRMDVAAVGAGVDGHSVDLLVAIANDGSGYAPIANWLHADGYGWGGLKVVAGDFNNDGRWDLGALGAGVNGGSVDLLVATSTGSSFRPIANWRHAEGFGWGGMTPIAGDFNNDGRWDFGALGAGVNGTSVDLLVATSTGSSFNGIANWRHAEGFGWSGMKPVAGDFDGDGRWDLGAIGAGVDGQSIDLLVATSTGGGFREIANWLHAVGYGWAGLAPASL